MSAVMVRTAQEEIFPIKSSDRLLRPCPERTEIPSAALGCSLPAPMQAEPLPCQHPLAPACVSGLPSIYLA